MQTKTVARGIAALGLIALSATQAASAQAGAASKAEIRRGKYLVTFGGCNDCHTPKFMTPKGPALDQARLLSGHPGDVPPAPVPANAIGPRPHMWAAMGSSDQTAWAGPWGISFAANLTPDRETGIGSWTAGQFIKTMRTGRHLGVARPLLPPMPWYDIATLNDRDLKAVFAYLQSLKPVRNPVPQPLPPQ